MMRQISKCDEYLKLWPKLNNYTDKVHTWKSRCVKENDDYNYMQMTFEFGRYVLHTM